MFLCVDVLIFFVSCFSVLKNIDPWFFVPRVLGHTNKKEKTFHSRTLISYFLSFFIVFIVLFIDFFLFCAILILLLFVDNEVVL